MSKDFYVLVWGEGENRYPTYAYRKKKTAKKELKSLGFRKIRRNLYEMDGGLGGRCEIMAVMGFLED